MPPFSSSRSAPVTVTSSPAARIWASQARRSCLGELRMARSAVRGAAVLSMWHSLDWVGKGRLPYALQRSYIFRRKITLLAACPDFGPGQRFDRGADRKHHQNPFDIA